MLLKLVRTFGSMIYSTISASTSVGVDIEAEQRYAQFISFAPKAVWVMIVVKMTLS